MDDLTASGREHEARGVRLLIRESGATSRFPGTGAARDETLVVAQREAEPAVELACRAAARVRALQPGGYQVRVLHYQIGLQGGEHWHQARRQLLANLATLPSCSELEEVLFEGPGDLPELCQDVFGLADELWQLHVGRRPALRFRFVTREEARFRLPHRFDASSPKLARTRPRRSARPSLAGGS
jgi:hypothetical protein